MRLSTLPIIGLVIGRASAHTVEVLTTPCETLTVHQDGAPSSDPTEPTLSESPIVLVKSPAPVELEHTVSTPVEPVTPCDTTESLLPTVPSKPAPESVYHYPTIESEDITTPVEAVTPCETTLSSAPTIPYEPVTESGHYVPPIVPPQTTSPGQHVQIMTTEPQPDCTESTDDAPTQHYEPGPETIHPTIPTSEVLIPTEEPSKYDVPEPHPPVSVPRSEPGQPPIPTEPVHTPVEEPIVIYHPPQPAPSSFKTVTSVVAAPTGEIIKLNLSEATLGLYTTFIEIDGRRAIRLAPPPNGEASFTLRVDEDLDFLPDSLVRFEYSIKVGDICPNPKRKTKLVGRVDTHNRFIVNADDKKVADENLEDTNGRFRRSSSDQFEAKRDSIITISLTGGSDPKAGTINEANIRSS